MIMKFKQWIRLDEIQHVSLPEPMPINGVVADSIDFRFEDWKKGFNPAKHRDVLAPSASGQRFFSGSFSAPLHPGEWLNVNRGGSGQMTHGNLGLAIAVQPEIQVSAEAEFQPLPGYWFNFAIMYLGNYVVKAPEWPRDEYEAKVAQVAKVDNSNT
jgi:hypothetical protein